MPEDSEKKAKIMAELGFDKNFHGGKVIAAMIGDALAELEQLDNSTFWMNV